MRKLFYILVAMLFVGCASAPAQTQTIDQTAQGSAAPAETVQPRSDLLATAIADFTDASTRAKAASAAAKDPAIQKLASDRALCYDTVLTHLTALTATGAAETSAKGIISLEEKGLEIHDQLQGQAGTGLIPLDIRANCASYAAQKTAAVASFFNRVVSLVGLSGNPMLTPLAAGAQTVGAALRAQ
jgi:hypothetical protein